MLHGKRGTPRSPPKGMRRTQKSAWALSPTKHTSSSEAASPASRLSARGSSMEDFESIGELAKG